MSYDHLAQERSSSTSSTNGLNRFLYSGNTYVRKNNAVPPALLKCGFIRVGSFAAFHLSMYMNIMIIIVAAIESTNVYMHRDPKNCNNYSRRCSFVIRYSHTRLDFHSTCVPKEPQKYVK